MHRRSAVVLCLIGLALTSCRAFGASSAPGSIAPAPTASPAGSAAPSAPDETITPSVGPSLAPGVHPATGLAFVRVVEEGMAATHVYVVEADGTLRQVTGLSRTSAGTSSPDWSPDGSQLAFGPPKNGAGMLFDVGVVGADGSDERVVGQGASPRWSPDGTRLLFTEVDDVTSEPHSMYVVDLAGGVVTDIGQGYNPQWLPDGQHIGFERNVDGGINVFVCSASGADATEIAANAAAAWSPDGSTVLLTHEGTIWLARSDGSEARELAPGYNPVWSPDGWRIAYTTGVDSQGVPLQAVMDRDGHTLWSGVPGAFPTWSPDGSRVALEVGYGQTVVDVLDAASGAVLWEIEGADPSWN
jgi:Tol biopolymer transport system component